MSPNRRIFLNVVVTYGRSLYSLAVGLFTARWALQALGHVDYGLIGLVGGLTGFISFFNGILAGAVGRFYGVSVGTAKKNGNEIEGLEECRKWFNTALSIHTLLPVVLLIIGYPCGVWAIEKFLTIPSDRMLECMWVWRFTCISCFIGMVNVPFNAMYTAKQEIAELTIYSFFSTTSNAIFLYYMINHPGVWMAKYSFWTMILSVTPQLIIVIRAIIKYHECKFVWSYWYDFDRYRQLVKFAVARFWASLSDMVSSQGRAILVNKYMGPTYNTAMTIGNNLAGHALTLSSSVAGAFWPAIANLAGEEKFQEVNKFCFMACRLSAVLMLIFAVPLSLEINEVLRLWLIEPPDFAAEICLVILAREVFEQMTNGYWMGILGRGIGVMKYSWIGGWAGMSTAGIAWMCFAVGFGMWSIVIGLACSKIITVATRLVLGESFIGLKRSYWFAHICSPILILAMLTFFAGLLVTKLIPASIVRVALTTCVCEIVFIPLAWLFVLENEERSYIVNKINSLIM